MSPFCITWKRQQNDIFKRYKIETFGRNGLITKYNKLILECFDFQNICFNRNIFIFYGHHLENIFAETS